MATFDPDTYFRARFGSSDLTKGESVAEATQRKLQDLRNYQGSVAAKTDEIVQRKAENEASLVGVLGLDPESAPGVVTNLVARGLAGASKNVVGNLIALPSDLTSLDHTKRLTEEDVQAYNRFVQNQFTPEDVARLSIRDVERNPFNETRLESFQNAAKKKKVAQGVRELFNIDYLTHKSNTHALEDQLRDGFQEPWDTVKSGWEQIFPSTMEGPGFSGEGQPVSGDQSAPPMRQRLDGVKDVVTGLGQLVLNAGAAAKDNPMAVTEYITENLPQLLVGAGGAANKAMLTATNASYAFDNYNQGIEKYKAEHNGAIPPEQLRQKMAMYAASLAVAEQVGDLNILRGAKVVDEVAKEASTSALKRALRTAGEVAKETTSEAATEGYQSFAEGEAQLKPASAQDIYTGAAIGGMVGGGLTGSLRIPAETVAAAKELASPFTKALEDRTAAANVVDKAIESGDVSALLDSKSKTYDPAKAIASLMGHSAREGTTEETKQANLTKAGEIVAELEARKQVAESEIKWSTPEGQQGLQASIEQAKQSGDLQLASDLEAELKAAQDPKKAEQSKKALAQIEQHLERAQEQMVRFNQDLSTGGGNGKVDVDSEVETIKAADPEQAPKAAEKVINLSMAAPESLDINTAESLASDETNGLTSQQRNYLRGFTVARQLEEQLKTVKGVAREVYAGGNGNLGIAQHRSRIAAALASGNKANAEQAINLLGAFANSHSSKAAAMAEAWSKGKGNQIVKTTSGQWVAAGSVPASQVVKDSTRTINSEGWVTAAQTEAKAIRASLMEMRAAYALKFSLAPAQGAQSVSDVQEAHAAAASPAKAVAEQEAPAVGGVTEGDVGSVSPAGSTDVETAGVAPKTKPDQPPVSRESQSTQSTENISVDSQLTSGVSDAAATQSQLSLAEGSSQYTNPTSTEAEARTADTQSQNSEKSSTETRASAESAEQTLSVLQEKSVEGASYQERNLIADYFTQTASKEGDSTQRPLASVKDFLSKGWDRVSEFFTGDLSEAQLALTTFKEAATDWSADIAANLARGKTRAFWHEDLMQFFVQESEGKLDLEENLKTAMSYGLFSWIAEQATRPAFNDEDAIREILGMDDTAIVEPEAKRLLADAGTRQNVVINALGQRAVQALGLKATKNAPLDLGPKLESHIGAHIFKLAIDRGILVRTSISAADMARLTGSKATDANASHDFVKLAQVDGKLNAEADSIVQAVKGSGGALDKLFKVEAGLKAPTREPVPFTQKTTRNTDQGVPNTLGKVVAKDNAVASYIDGDMYDFGQHVDEDILASISGAEHVDKELMHKANRLSVEAKNDGLLREIRSFKEFVAGLVKEDDSLSMPLYFEHSVWKQQRVGIATNLINPQTSKVHRHMLFRKSWETSIDRNDQEQVNNFHLRVAEALGVKTDKQSNEKSLEAYQKKVAEPAIQAAVKVLQKRLAGGDLSRVEQETVRDGVSKGGENFHTLHALMSLAHEANAIEAGKDTFTVRLMGEVDGVTNGPMLSHLLLGAAKSVKDLFGLLNRGGFFEVGNEHNQYNLWRGAAGHFDLYETTALHMTQAVQRIFAKKPNMQSVLNTVYAFTGQLEKNSVVQKAGRDIIKTPLTAMVFGSSVPSAVDSMANNFVESIYAAIEKTVTGKENHQPLDVLIGNINTLLVMGGANTISTKLSIEQLMEREFKPDEVTALKQAFKDTIGQAVAETMKQDFAEYISRRTQLNLAAQMTFELYNSVYSALRDQMVAELTKSGEIAVDKNGVPLHDLTQAQEAELEKRLAKMAPLLHTPMSKDSGSLRAGLRIAKSSRRLSDKKTYSGEVKFGREFKDKKSKSLITHAQELTEKNPGVAMVPMSTHSADSAVMHGSIGDTEVLNVHDAKGVGVAGFQQAAQSLNESVFKVMLNYSPASEMQAALSRTVQGLSQLIESGDLPSQAVENLKVAAARVAKKLETEPAAVVGQMMAMLKQTATTADEIKLGALSQMQAIDQYALEGGNYELSDADREAAAKRKAGLSSELSAEEKKAIEVVEGVLKEAARVPKQETPIEEDPVQKTSPFGELGKSNKGDSFLLAFFQENPEPTARQMMERLHRRLSEGSFEKKLLRVLNKAVNPDLKIKLITVETQEADVLAKPETASLGWYTAKGGEDTIYIVGPDFKKSNIVPELLLHELVHAATAYRLTTAAGKPYRDELELLLNEAQKYVKANGLESKFAPALTNIDELVAYGMTSRAFQQEVLAKVSMKADKRGLSTAMQQFVDLLARLLGFKDADAANGLGTLITNVAALMEQEATERKGFETGPLSMASNPVGVLNDYKTLDIHEALSAGNISSGFDAQLRGVLNGIVEKLHGPFGVLASTMKQNQAMTALDAWLKAMATGETPFASSAQSSPFAISERELHAMEQVEATMREALSRNEVTAKTVYKELAKLYEQMREKLTPADFQNADQYDFLFNEELDSNGRSHHLARFAAFGLANEQVNKLLQVQTPVDTRQPGKAKTFAEKVQILFEQVLEFFHTKITGTYSGQPADAKLNKLVDQLVDIEAKKRIVLARAATGNNPVDLLELQIKEGAGKARDAIAKTAEKLHKNAKNPFVRAAGGLVSTYANDRVEDYMKALTDLRDQMSKEKHGLAMGLLNDVRGIGKTFNALMLATTNSQRLRKQTISQTASMVLDSFVDGTTMSEDTKKAVTYTFMRTGLHTLVDQFNMTQLETLVGDKTVRDTEIAALESQLAGTGISGKLVAHMIHQANALGYFKATGISRVEKLMLNAHNIARMYGTSFRNQVNEAQVTAAAPIIEKLVSLYALGYTHKDHLDLAQDVLKTENGRKDGKGNAVEFMLKLHKRLDNESRARLFREQEALMVHGYTPEIYNPHTELVTADAIEGDALKKMGYVQVGKKHLPRDPADPNQTPKYLYKLKDGGLMPYLTGIMSYTGKATKGSKIHSGYLNVNVAEGLQNAADNADILFAKNGPLASGPRPDLSKSKGTYMVPVMSPRGEIVNWRYMMQEGQKDALLDRDNRFDRVMGALTGSIYDKETTTELNTKAVEALKEQYDLEHARHSDSYVLVGAKSSDPELNETWHMLPDDTQKAIKKIWGYNGMYVRKDLLTPVFGYRKATLTNLVTADTTKIKNPVERELTKLFQGLVKELFGDKAALRVTQGERVWQEIVHEVKDIIVVKSGMVMIGNIWSNLSLLALSGVPMTSIVKDHLVALRGARAYQDDNEELNRLQALIDTGTAGTNLPQVQREITRLTDAINRNPVKNLIDAGLMPTIVEDVAQDDDIYSYKNLLVRKTDKYAEKVHPGVLTAAKNVYMARDTRVYQGLTRITQLSDFIARYTLYQHLTTRKINPLSHEDAVFEASESFINYDIPMHKGMQYLDDMGVTMFTKYFLRIQRVLLRMSKDNPARVFSTMLLSNFLDLGPIVLDGSAVHKVGNNPFYWGALQFPTTLDELATVSGSMALVK